MQEGRSSLMAGGGWHWHVMHFWKGKEEGRTKEEATKVSGDFETATSGGGQCTAGRGRAACGRRCTTTLPWDVVVVRFFSVYHVMSETTKGSGGRAEGRAEGRPGGRRRAAKNARLVDSYARLPNLQPEKWSCEAAA